MLLKSQADRILAKDRGTNGYLDKWGHPYPQEALNKLEHGLAVEREERRLTEQSDQS